MDTDEIFGYLNRSEKPKNWKHELRSYLKSQVDHYHEQPENAEKIAYQIAGLLGTKFAAEMPEDDPYIEVLEMAGRLELPERYHGDANWPDLIRQVEQLI